MHAAIGREMAMRKQVAAMQDQFVKVRDIFDKALGTTKGATTFTLTDIAEEMALQRARFNKERDAAIKECDAARARADKAERTQADDAHAARVTLANAQSLLDKATRGRDSMCAERDRLRAQVDRMIAAMREDAPTAKTKPQPGDVVPWAEVEDGALYYRENQNTFPFRMVTQDVGFILEGPAGEAGIAKQDLDQFAESAAKVSVAFGVTAEEAGSGMAKMRSSLGLTQDEVESLAGTMNYLSNNMAVTAKQAMEVVLGWRHREGLAGGLWHPEE